MIKTDFYDLFEQAGDGDVYDDYLLSFSTESLIPNKHKLPALFRYSKADYYNIRGLETQTLYLSPIGEMNDVFEGLSCTITDSVLDRLEHFKDFAFLKSFSEEKNNLLMWAHYAENYAGMCVEYDFSNLSDDLLYHLYPVFYTKVRAANHDLNYAITEYIDLCDMNKGKYCPNDTFFLHDTTAWFLRKSAEWAYEKEWRIAASYAQIYNTAEEIDDLENEQLYKINSREISVASCIKSVYLGARMKQEIKNHIKEICRERLGGIPVYATQLSKEKYELEICSK